MGDNYKKVQAGDLLRFPAPVYNKLIDLVQKGPRTGAGDVIRSHRSSGILDVHNNSTIDLDVGQILGIGGPLWTTDENEDDFQYDPSLTGVEPSVDYDTGGKFAVAIEPVPQDTIAPMAVSGVVPVRVYVNSIDDKFCDVVEKETVGADPEADPPELGEDCYLGTGSSGAQILWLEDGAVAETIVWAIVRLGVAAGTTTNYYILIQDLDGTETTPFYAKANPGTINTVTGLLEDAHTTNGVPDDDPEWTVVLVDPTGGQIPCWYGDWVEASPSNLTLEGFEGYSFAEIKAKQSSQLDFFGELTTDLSASDSANASLIINAFTRSKTVYDFAMLPEGQVLLHTTPIRATFLPNARLFVVTQAPCAITLTP
jgi:hypothetical protein